MALTAVGTLPCICSAQGLGKVLGRAEQPTGGKESRRDEDVELDHATTPTITVWRRVGMQARYDDYSFALLHSISTTDFERNASMIGAAKQSISGRRLDADLVGEAEND